MRRKAFVGFQKKSNKAVRTYTSSTSWGNPRGIIVVMGELVEQLMRGGPGVADMSEVYCAVNGLQDDVSNGANAEAAIRAIFALPKEQRGQECLYPLHEEHDSAENYIREVAAVVTAECWKGWDRNLDRVGEVLRETSFNKSSLAFQKEREKQVDYLRGGCLGRDGSGVVWDIPGAEKHVGVIGHKYSSESWSCVTVETQFLGELFSVMWFEQPEEFKDRYGYADSWQRTKRSVVEAWLTARFGEPRKPVFFPK